MARIAGRHRVYAIPMKFTSLAILGVLAGAAGAPAQEPRPSCDRCSASYVAAEELQAYLKRAPALSVQTGVSDQQVRAVDVGKSHVDVAVVYRPKLTAR